MGMGSAYSAGAGMVQKQDSYVPLLESSRRRGVDASNASIANRRMTLEERKWNERDRGGLSRRGSGSSADNYARADRKRQRQIEEDKQMYGTYNDGSRESTPAPIQQVGGLQTPNQYEGEDLEKQKWRERQGKMDRAEREDDSGLAERKDLREQEKHDMEMKAGGMGLSQEERTQEHSEMMKAFVTGDYNEVSAWFIKNGKPGDDKSLSYPIIEETDDPEFINVEFPGKEPKLMSKKAFGELLSTFNPKFEHPKSGKELGRQEKPMAKKDIAKAAADYAKGISEGGGSYEESYREKYEELSGGGNEGGKTVVRKQQNRATGQIRITYSDGTTEIQ